MKDIIAIVQIVAALVSFVAAVYAICMAFKARKHSKEVQQHCARLKELREQLKR